MLHYYTQYFLILGEARKHVYHYILMFSFTATVTTTEATLTTVTTEITGI